MNSLAADNLQAALPCCLRPCFIRLKKSLDFPILITFRNPSEGSIHIIALILPFMLLALWVAYPALADDPPDAGAVTISANKDIFTPADTMRISVSVAASQIDTNVADLYIVVRNPDGGFSSIYEESDWIVLDKPLQEIASIKLKTMRIGPYSWFLVLCPPGKDLFDINTWIAFAAVEVFLLPHYALPLPKSGRTPSYSDSSPPVLIAHAGGAFDGRTGLNSRQALDRNYAKGHRYFEIDLNWTSDERLVLIHDWKTTFTGLFEEAKERPSLERFKSMKMKHGMTQMSLESLLIWLSKNPDAHIITDVKERNLFALKTIAASAGTLRNRFIPQIYGPSEFEPVRKLGFERIIFTLYRSGMTDNAVTRFASDNGLFAITMPVRRAFSFSQLGDLNRTGIPVYVHTMNKVEAFYYLREEGIHGIYTDEILPNDRH